MPTNSSAASRGSYNRAMIISSSKESVNNIYGLPPAAYQDTDYKSIILNSMPVLELTPGYPQYKGIGSTGLKLYTFSKSEGDRQFSKILGSLGMHLPQTPMQFAFQYESPITESFSNDYTESMFEEIGNFKIPFLREATYITGKKKISDALAALGPAFGQTPDSMQKAIDGLGPGNGPLEKQINSTLGFLGKTLTGGASAVAGAAEEFTKLNFGRFGGQILKLLQGSNIDFPKMWANSTYTPSYTASIKLINPDPGNEDSYDNYILYPLIYLLSFVTPVSDSESTFTFPLLCRANCPGLFKIDSGYIQSADVIKGGEAGDIAFNQRPGTIEVRLTFAEAYNTMISSDKQYEAGMDADRPTLLKYVENLKGSMNGPAWGMGYNTSNTNTSNVSTSEAPDTFYVGQPTITNPSTPRVPTASVDTYNGLKVQSKTSVSEDSGYAPTPLISNVDKKTRDAYDDAANNADKTRLERLASTGEVDWDNKPDWSDEYFDAVIKKYPNGVGRQVDITSKDGITYTSVIESRGAFPNELDAAKASLDKAATSKLPTQASQNVDMQLAGLNASTQTNTPYTDWKTAKRTDNSTIPNPQNNAGLPNDEWPLY